MSTAEITEAGIQCVWKRCQCFTRMAWL